jgi:uncharacterized protein involved in exopolysaccharide biosynthesis
MSKQPTLAEVYATLNQLVEAYTAVMGTFSSVVTDVQQLRQEVAELRTLMRAELADATTARDVWQAVAEAHKAQVAQLKLQIEALQSGGC